MPTVRAEVAASTPVIMTEAKHQDLLDACHKHAKNPNYCYRVMRGVFKADSQFCTTGAGAKNLNCGNARPGSGKYGDTDVTWTVAPSPGNGFFRKYATIRDGIFDNVAIYAQLYEGTSVEYMRENWAKSGSWWANTVYQSINQN